MSSLRSLETSCNDLFVKKSPPLPEKGKTFITTYAPYISAIIGTLTLAAAWSLWHWAHLANNLINYANEMSRMYGGDIISTNRMNATVWLALIVLVVEAFMYLAAFQPLRDGKKSGWNLLFYAALVNLVYGVISIFTQYNGMGSFLGVVLSTAVGLYLLFQVRAHYIGEHAPTSHAPATKK